MTEKTMNVFKKDDMQDKESYKSVIKLQVNTETVFFFY